LFDAQAAIWNRLVQVIQDRVAVSEENRARLVENGNS
jgi:hypothetical protein